MVTLRLDDNAWTVALEELARISSKHNCFPDPAKAMADVLRTMRDWYPGAPKYVTEISAGVLVEFNPLCLGDDLNSRNNQGSRVEMVLRSDGLHLTYFEPENEIVDTPIVIDTKGN